MKTFKLDAVKNLHKSNQLLHESRLSLKNAGKKGLSIILIFCILFSGCKKSISPENQLTPTTKSATNLNASVSGSDFTIIVIPDTQNYTSGYFGGQDTMFYSQMHWIVNNRTAQNIAYVAGLGDEVEHGDSPDSIREWHVASKAYYMLDAANIPYGVAVGNHEQTPLKGSILTVTTKHFNQYFGRSHFASKPYYGGNIGGPQDTTNNSHYDLFSAGGKDFMVIYLEYDQNNEKASTLNDWAWGLCNTYSSRKVIVVTHYMIGLGDPGAFGAQGQGIYDRLKDRPNVFMFLGGHIYGTSEDGEGYREDTYQGHTIRTYLSDYQQRQVNNVHKGGNGLLRIMKFSVTNDDVTVKTFSPFTGAYETDINSQFTKPLFGAAPTATLPDGKYKIINVNSNKAIVVKDALTTNGGTVVQWDYTSVAPANDEWNLTQIGTSGYYKITNVNSGKAMLVGAGATNNGANIVQWDYTSALPADDEWAIISVGSGNYKLIARHSGLCASIQGASLTNGAQVEQWDYLGQTNEQFKLVPITP